MFDTNNLVILVGRSGKYQLCMRSNSPGARVLFSNNYGVNWRKYMIFFPLDEYSWFSHIELIGVSMTISKYYFFGKFFNILKEG